MWASLSGGRAADGTINDWISLSNFITLSLVRLAVSLLRDAL
jgi:hypothetical protein